MYEGLAGESVGRWAISVAVVAWKRMMLAEGGLWDTLRGREVKPYVQRFRSVRASVRRGRVSGQAGEEVT